MNVSFLTDKGVSRSLNEDSGQIFIHEKQWLAIVADGMGGHQAGEVASQKTLEYINAAWESIEKPLPMGESEQWLINTITDINGKLLTYANENDECRGMGTTIVAVLGTDTEITVSHVGDSRAYLFTKDGQSLLTRDHTLVQELVNRGQLSEEDAKVHPRKHMLIRALGTEEDIKVDCHRFSFNEGDTLLICSDGLSDLLPSEDMETIIENASTLNDAAKDLINKALELGATDNITVALVQNEKGEPV